MRLSTRAVLAYGSDAPAVFDPATLSLTGWWRASFGGAPWTPTASAGTSGAHGNLIAGTAPGVGTAQNTLTPADFNGTTHRLVSATATTSFVSQAAGTIVAVFLSDSAVAQSAGYDDPTILTNGNAEFALRFTSSGAGAMVYDGGYKLVNAACGTGAYHIAMARWNSTIVGVTVDSGAEVTLSAGALATLTADTLIVGTNYASGAFFDGRLLDLMVANTALTATDFGHIKSYANSRYALSL